MLSLQVELEVVVRLERLLADGALYLAITQLLPSLVVQKTIVFPAQVQLIDCEGAGVVVNWHVVPVKHFQEIVQYFFICYT